MTLVGLVSGPVMIVDNGFRISFLSDYLLENFGLELIGEVVGVVLFVARVAEAFPLEDQLDPLVKLLGRDLLECVVLWLDLLCLLSTPDSLLEEDSECVDNR